MNTAKKTKNAEPPKPVKRYPEDLLKSGGAKSSVTGGHPEEMNEMPADTDLDDPNPTYDGSDLTPL